MSLSEILIKVGGVILFIVGLALLLSLVGIRLVAIGTFDPILSVILGVLFICGGVVLIRGGSITF